MPIPTDEGFCSDIDIDLFGDDCGAQGALSHAEITITDPPGDAFLTVWNACCDERDGNHGAWVKCVTKEAKKLMKAGAISGAEKGLTTSCAAQNENWAEECPFVPPLED